MKFSEKLWGTGSPSPRGPDPLLGSDNGVFG